MSAHLEQRSDTEKVVNAMGKSHEAELPEGDREFLLRISQAQGPKREGHVLVISQELGSGYVVEDTSGDKFTLSRRWIASDLFDRLQAGSFLLFRINEHNVITEASAH